MIYLVIEDKRATIFSTPVIEKFPKSSIVKVNKYNAHKEMSLIKMRPTLTNTWLVLVDNNVPEPIVEQLLEYESNCIILLYCDENNIYFRYNILNSKCKTYRVNVKTMNKEDCEKYIKDRINISVDALHSMTTENNFMPYIEECLIVLESLDKQISKEDVINYIPKRMNVTVYDVFYNLINYKIGNTKSIVSFLYQFKYAWDYIQTKIVMLCNITLKLYNDIEDGILGADNVDEYYNNNGKLGVSIYFVKLVILKLFPKISYLEIISNRLLVERLEDIPSLLQYIK